MRPQSIIRFERAYLASVLVWLVNLVVGWDTKMGAIRRDPRFGGNPQMVAMGETMMIGVSVAGLLLSLLLWYLAARRGSEAAKWILVVLLAFSTIGLVSALLQVAAVGALSLALTVLAFALNAYAVWMLFTPEAKAWMSGAPEEAEQPVE